MRRSPRAPAGLRALLMTMVALFLAPAPCAAQAAKSVEGNALTDRVAEAAWWGDYDELERLYAVARNATEPSAGGAAQLELFRIGFARIFNGANNDAFYSQLDALTGRWAEDHPASSLAQNMYARALYAHAWFLRSGGYSSEVTPQAAAEFRRYLGLARDVLRKQVDVVKTDTTTNLYLIMIERSEGTSFDTQWAIAQDALRKDPKEEAVYYEMVTATLPKWGGNADELEVLVEHALRRTQATRGLEMYARIYLTAAYEYKGGLFQQTHADWPKMKQGLRDILSRHPDSYNLDRFAFAACLAQDKPTTLEMLDRLGDKRDPAQWGKGVEGVSFFDSCNRWARSP